MGQPQVERKTYTIEEWLELEQNEGVRYEYHLGEVFAMAGGTLNHGTLSGNAFRLIENSFVEKDANCRAFISDLKIEISKAGRYVYPDTLAVCGDVEESEIVKGSIVNPVLVVEVSSKSSVIYDREVKFEYYTALPSVKQYMIASQSHPLVTLYNRNPETGDFDLPVIEIRGLMGSINLFSVNYVMEMKQLYRNVEFEQIDLKLHSVK